MTHLIFFRVICVILALLLVSCASQSKTNTDQQIFMEMRAISDLADNREITLAESFRRQRDVVRRYERLSAADEAYWSSAIAILERYDLGLIRFSEADALVKEAHAIRVRINSANAAEQRAICEMAKRNKPKNDYSGLDSTSGVVAIISLLALLADVADSVRGCD